MRLSLLKVHFQDGESVLGALRQNFNNEKYSDITICLESNEKVFCHKVILSTGSLVLGTMFQSGMKEATATEIQVKGEPNALWTMLWFFYSGHCDIDDDNVAAVTAVADCFHVSKLHEFCQVYISSHLKVRPDNCIKLLTTGFAHKVDKLFTLAANYIIKTGSTSEGVQELTYPLMQSIVELSKNYSGSLANLVSIVEGWMNYQSDRREQGIALLAEVDLSTLSFSELANACRLKIMRETPALQSAVVEALASKSSNGDANRTPALPSPGPPPYSAVTSFVAAQSLRRKVAMKLALERRMQRR